MKTITSLIFVFVLGFTSFSQNALKSEDLSGDWNSILNQDGIEILIKKTTCQVEGVDKLFTYGFVKVINSTNKHKEIQFRVELTFTDGCTGCDNPNEDIKTVTIKPNSSIETECSSMDNSLSFLINNPFQLDHKELVEVLLNEFKTL